MQVEQLNVEYWFRVIYELFRTLKLVQGDGSLYTLAAKIWFLISVIGYLVSFVALLVLIYATMKLFEIRRREEEYYRTLIVTEGSRGEANPRWQHIQALLEGGSPSQWREAITEADILLDDLLRRRGFVGEGVAEKLRAVDETELASLEDAWEAHKVRNQIAHEGSAFQLSESLAQRTLARYQNVFREWGEVA